MGGSAGEFALGIMLATAAAASLALSMVIQRYALATGEPTVQLFGTPVRSNVVWFLGLIGYGAANGLYVASLQYGPLALLASVFTTLLVFNCVFARCLLGEALTPPKLAGCGVILGGVVLVVVGSPKNVEVDLDASDVTRLVAKPLGATYLCCLVGAVAASVAAIRAFEARYPMDAPKGAGPPPRLDRLMGLIYPGSLGLDEAIAHLSMKAAVSMLARLPRPRPPPPPPALDVAVRRRTGTLRRRSRGSSPSSGSARASARCGGFGRSSLATRRPTRFPSSTAPSTLRAS